MTIDNSAAISKFKKHSFWIILLCAFLSFGATLGVGFIWDDHEMIENNLTIRDFHLSTLSTVFSRDVFEGKGDAYFRPLQTLMNMIDYKIWGLHPFGYHLTNLLFHVLGAWFLFLLLNLLTDDFQISFLTAVLFSVHPIVVEQLLIIAGRAELMSFSFMMMSLYCFFRSNRPRDIFFSWCFFSFACLSKESGVVLPGFIFLIQLLYKQFKKPIVSYIPFILILIGYFTLRARVTTALVTEAFSVSTFLFKELPTILTQYARTLLLPVSLHSHHRMVFHPMWLYLSPIILFLITYWAWKQQSKLIWLGIGWFLIGFLPKFPLLATNSLMIDHWAYVSSVGLLLIFTSQLEKVKNFLMSKVIYVTFFIFWITISWLNIFGRSNDLKMYQWALHYPTSSIVRYNLAELYFTEGKLDDAEKLFQESLKINQKNPMALNGLALARWRKGDSAGALVILDDAYSQFPDFKYTLSNRCLVKGISGLQDCDEFLKYEPKNMNGYLIKGDLLYKDKQWDLAIETYSKLLSMDPQNVPGLTNLAAALYSKGDVEKAKSIWRKILEFNPGNEIAAKNLEKFK